MVKSGEAKKSGPVSAQKLLEFECFKKKQAQKMTSTSRGAFNILEFQKFRAMSSSEKQKFVDPRTLEQRNREVENLKGTDPVLKNILKLKNIKGDINLLKLGPAARMG